MAMLTETIQARFPQHVIGAHHFRGQETVVIQPGGLLEAAWFLRDDPAMAFDFLMDLTCVDYLTFGRSQASRPTLATPSPLPYYMTPKPVAETWQRFGSHDPSTRATASGRGLAQDSAPQAEPAGLHERRFDMVYHFYSSLHNHRVRVKAPLAAAEAAVDSLTGLWASADWFEREAWDMFGVRFRGHPNLKRILLYEEFTGHPLRKDYPIRKRQPLIGPVN